jgi:predicted nucleic acid-binding protein
LLKDSWNARWAVLADAGPLYGAFDPADQYHDRAQSELRRLEVVGLDVIVLRPTVIEVHSLILQKLGHRRALAWLDEVISGAFLYDPAPDEFEAALALLRAFPDQPLSLADLLLASAATRLDLPVWTYDHHFDVMRSPVWR